MDNKYKTKLCTYFNKYRKCNNGDKCNYAHGEEELRCLFNEKCINETCKRIHTKRDKVNIVQEDKDDVFPELNYKNTIKNVNEEGKMLYSEVVKEKETQDKKEINTDVSFNIDSIDNNEIDYLINDMENIFEKYSKNIKQTINHDIKSNDIKFILLNNLNEIKMDIILLKNNYKDITNIKKKV